MKMFDSKRIEEFLFEVNNDKFPFTKISPKNNIEKCDKLVIFLSGLNGNSNFIKYFSNDCFDDVFLISYDPRAQANNKLKPSQKFKKYLSDLDKIINKYLEENQNIKEIYLIGESWGSCLAFLYNKYYPNKVKGTLGWNMPYEIVDTSKKEDNNFMLKLKVVVTLLTWIDTEEKSILTEEMTNNAALRRLIINSRRLKLSNKVIIASWRSFKKSWKYFLKNKDNQNFLYIQSKDDILKSKKIFKKIKSKNNIIFLEEGTHLLSFDINVSNQLFSLIKKFIEK